MSESLFSSRRIEQEKYAHIPYVLAFFLKKLDISVITVILKVHCFFFLTMFAIRCTKRVAVTYKQGKICVIL